VAQVTRTSEEILPEDRVTNALIDKYGRASVEVPYNNYGERGYVDLVQNRPRGTTYIIEIKSSPESANQVIRQFQKMRRNFAEGTSYQPIHEQKSYWLVFTASHSNLEHLRNNKSMYRSLNSEENVSIRMCDEEGNHCVVFKDEKINTGNNQGMGNLKGVSQTEQLICPYCGKEYKMDAYYRKHVQKCNEDQKVRRID
jgi:hypothetical protein